MFYLSLILINFVVLVVFGLYVLKRINGIQHDLLKLGANMGKLYVRKGEVRNELEKEFVAEVQAKIADRVPKLMEMFGLKRKGV